MLYAADLHALWNQFPPSAGAGAQNREFGWLRQCNGGCHAGRQNAGGDGTGRDYAADPVDPSAGHFQQVV